MKKPFVIAIAGCSGSGKSTFSQMLLEEFKEYKVELLPTDKYFNRPLPKMISPLSNLEYDDYNCPESLNFEKYLEDVKAITQAQGVGPKLAQRVVLELKNKLKIDLEEAVGILKEEDMVSSQVSGSLSEATAALVSLGYSRTEAQSALKGADLSLSTEDLIKIGLKKLMS